MHDSVKQRADVDLDWLESNTLIINDRGEMDAAGTVIKVTNTLIFLKPLTTEQLIKLKEIVTAAVDHEIKSRDVKIV